jgi:mannose-6-phosphate isomerase-like protein (cupin superfamily)
MLIREKKIIHNPEMLGPHTETMGLVAPGDWIDFFRYVGETYAGLISPEFDSRNIREHLMGRMMKADRDYDVNFVRDYKPPEVGEFDAEDSKIPEGCAPYYLRANTGPRWLAGGVMSRPFCTTAQTTGKFAMTSLESSKEYGESILSRYMTFPHVDHCFSCQEGALVVKMKNGGEYTVREGETAVIPAGQGFALGFASKYVRVWTFTSGDGVEAVIHKAGGPYEGFVLPDAAQAFDQQRLESACRDLRVSLD